MSTPVYRKNVLCALATMAWASGNPFWQPNQRNREGSEGPCGLKAQIRTMGMDGLHGLDSPDRPPEPVARVRVLPGALCDVSRHRIPPSEPLNQRSQNGRAHLHRRRRLAVWFRHGCYHYPEKGLTTLDATGSVNHTGVGRSSWAQ